MCKMDTFTRRFLAISFAGACICAIANKARENESKAIDMEDSRSEYVERRIEEEAQKDFCYGDLFGSPLEKEGDEFYAATTSQGRFVAQVYTTGDWYNDPRVMIVRDADTGEIVQVASVASHWRTEQ